MVTNDPTEDRRVKEGTIEEGGIRGRHDKELRLKILVKEACECSKCFEAKNKESVYKHQQY